MFLSNQSVKYAISRRYYLSRKFLSDLRRSFSSETTTMNKNEIDGAMKNRLENLLKDSFPNSKEILVKDISGGCGFMFEIYVTSSSFQGMSKVKQHLTVSNVLKNEIKQMHGVRIFTEIPQS
ncbi:BolA-like protein 3 [Sarcoptes scabiei]|uniref:BolA-like protein 3 n=1 Tax=Sarcoptes scabiei TaxID=52283 RepID=A0A834VB83_SARSC|nr:BolA-like protein 3 [Sarcoptes scabiei]